MYKKYASAMYHLKLRFAPFEVVRSQGKKCDFLPCSGGFAAAPGYTPGGSTLFMTYIFK
ncbi:MAG: hypothetical protein DELT_02621 [Desulfovibrio sp.]